MKSEPHDVSGFRVEETQVVMEKRNLFEHALLVVQNAP
jgi:hypothetical protein